MSPNFKSLYKKVVSQAPKDWDILFLQQGKSKVRCEDKILSSNLYEMRRPVTTPDGLNKFYNGIDAYIVRKQSLPKILKMFNHNKAAPLSELLMSVHTEEKERMSNGKINYKVDGIYSYMVNEAMLAAAPVEVKKVAPKAPTNQTIVNVKDKTVEKKEDPKKKKSLLQTV